MPFLILSNSRLLKSHVLSATEQAGAFVQQPLPSNRNVGDLIPVSLGTFFDNGGEPPTIRIRIRVVGGGIGVSKFTYSLDNWVTEYGANADSVFSKQELVVEGI